MLLKESVKHFEINHVGSVSRMMHGIKITTKEGRFKSTDSNNGNAIIGYIIG